MNSLATGRVAKTLERLHREAEAADGDYLASVMEQSEDSRETLEQAVGLMLAAERADYRGVYRVHAEHFLSVSPATGVFLYTLARMRGATRIVEFGTSMGISTIYLAAALRDNGGGRLIGSELEPAKAAKARANIAAAGFADLVEVREGCALQTLAETGAIDLLLIDGAFSLYLPVLKLLEQRFTPGAAILGENAFAPDYLAYVRDPANGYLSQALAIDEGRGNELTVCVA